jgi:hypothetical protein
MIPQFIYIYSLLWETRINGLIYLRRKIVACWVQTSSQCNVTVGSQAFAVIQKGKGCYDTGRCLTLLNKNISQKITHDWEIGQPDYTRVIKHDINYTYIKAGWLC